MTLARGVSVVEPRFSNSHPYSPMKSQWQCIQQNIGTWRGSFTQFSPDGIQVKDTPSVLTLTETEPDKKMQITLERTPANGQPETIQREFSYPGPAPYVYFFETGAFAQGSAQWAAFGQFGAEISLNAGDKRLRFVIMYDSTSAGTSKIKYVTLIRETRTSAAHFEEPSLTLEQLLGQWEGSVSILYANMEPMSTGSSQWQLDKSLVLSSQEDFGETVKKLSLGKDLSEESSAKSENILSLTGDLPYQLMLLPNGAYCLLPKIIQKDIAFQIETGWLSIDQALSGSRIRLIRYYDARGVWTDSALIADRPVL
jgi:hypothetical protein